MIVSIGVAAQFLGMSSGILRCLADRGVVPHIVTKGGHRRFDTEELAKLDGEQVLKAKFDWTALVESINDASVTLQHASRLLGISRHKIEMACERGELPFFQDVEFGWRRIRVSDLEAYRERLIAKVPVSQSLNLDRILNLIADLINTKESQNGMAKRYGITQSDVSKLYRRCKAKRIPVQDRPIGSEGRPRKKQ